MDNLDMTIERRANDSQRFENIENKIDNLAARVGVHEDHHEYIAIAMAREARKESLHRAIIEKTISSLIWSAVVGLGYLLWQGITSHWKW